MNPLNEQHANGSEHDRRISLKQDYEVRYWTLALDVSKDELMALVEQHGHSARGIREALLVARKRKTAGLCGSFRPRAAAPSRSPGSSS